MLTNTSVTGHWTCLLTDTPPDLYVLSNMSHQQARTAEIGNVETLACHNNLILNSAKTRDCLYWPSSKESSATTAADVKTLHESHQWKFWESRVPLGCQNQITFVVTDVRSRCMQSKYYSLTARTTKPSKRHTGQPLSPNYCMHRAFSWFHHGNRPATNQRLLRAE